MYTTHTHTYAHTQTCLLNHDNNSISTVNHQQTHTASHATHLKSMPFIIIVSIMHASFLLHTIYLRFFSPVRRPSDFIKSIYIRTHTTCILLPLTSPSLTSRTYTPWSCTHHTTLSSLVHTLCTHTDLNGWLELCQQHISTHTSRAVSFTQNRSIRTERQRPYSNVLVTSHAQQSCDGAHIAYALRIDSIHFVVLRWSSPVCQQHIEWQCHAHTHTHVECEWTRWLRHVNVWWDVDVNDYHLLNVSPLHHIPCTSSLFWVFLLLSFQRHWSSSSYISSSYN